MKKVKGITITSLLHNGVFYEPHKKIEISVSEKEYEFLKNYVDFSIPQTDIDINNIEKQEETKEKIVKEKERPNIKVAEANKPSLRAENGKMFKN